jgi:phosphoglycolate phosphatase
MTESAATTVCPSTHAAATGAATTDPAAAMASGRRPRRPEAVIFDLDGTLADTLQDIAAAMDRVLRGAGLPPHTRDEYRLMIGHGLRNLVTQALPEGARGDEQVAGLLQAMLADYGEHCLVETRLYEGIAELLASLRDLAVPLAVLSNKGDELTRRIVEGLAPRVFRVVAGAQTGVPLKPDAAAALRVAAGLRVAPATVALVGDSDVDMQTALAAGMIPVGVAWGLRGRDELVASGARVVLAQPLQLLELFR